MKRLILAVLFAPVLWAMGGCCSTPAGKKTPEMIQCRTTTTDDATCKACCTKAGGKSAFYSKSMGCECN